jgi:hypothetical protein
MSVPVIQVVEHGLRPEECCVVINGHGQRIDLQ